MAKTAPEEKPFQSVLEKRPRHVRAIGMVSIELANLEIMLGDLLAVILGIPNEIGESIYLTPRSSMGRAEILENVAQLAFPTFDLEKIDPASKITAIQMNKVRTRDQSRVENIVKRTKAIIGKRHVIIHQAWGMPQNKRSVSRRSLPIKAKAKPIPVKLGELTSLSTIQGN